MLGRLFQQKNIIFVYGKSGYGKTYIINKFVEDNRLNLIGLNGLSKKEIIKIQNTRGLRGRSILYYDLDKTNKVILNVLDNISKKLIIEVRDIDLIVRSYPVYVVHSPVLSDKIKYFIHLSGKEPNKEQIDKIQKCDSFWDVKYISMNLPILNLKDKKLKCKISDSEWDILNGMSRVAPISKFLNVMDQKV